MSLGVFWNEKKNGKKKKKKGISKGSSRNVGLDRFVVLDDLMGLGR